MRITAIYENGQVFQHFGHTKQFRIYEVAKGKVVSARVVETGSFGYGALADFLQGFGVDTLICGGIGGGVRSISAKVRIQLHPGVSGSADAQVEALLDDSLAYNPNTVCSHYDHGEGHTCGHHHEGGRAYGSHDHGCGHHD